MKRLFAMSVLLLLAMSANASGWLHDYDKALEQAKQTHKPIIMMFSEKT